jgi:hypothetical protein
MRKEIMAFMMLMIIAGIAGAQDYYQRTLRELVFIIKTYPFVIYQYFLIGRNLK